MKQYINNLYVNSITILKKDYNNLGRLIFLLTNIKEQNLDSFAKEQDLCILQNPADINFTQSRNPGNSQISTFLDTAHAV